MNEHAKKRGRGEALATAVVLVMLAVVTVIVGADRWLPELASRHGAGIDEMLIFLLVATGVFFVAGHLILGLYVWRSSGREKVAVRMASPRAEKRIGFGLAIVIALVAEGGVLVIGLPVWTEYFATAPPEDSVHVELMAQQFAWNVRYPGEDGKFGPTSVDLMDEEVNPIGLMRSEPEAADDVTTTNRLYLPVDRPAWITLKSKDVLHSFFVPQFRVKQDAVPGMTIDIWFVPTQTGTYELACTELCGLGHYRMRGMVEVVSAEEFDGWLRENKPEPESADDFWG